MTDPPRPRRQDMQWQVMLVAVPRSQQMKAGKGDQEILAFLTQRYGDFVLYNPPVKSTTYLLWFGPFVLLIAGAGVLYGYLKHRRELIKDKPLTAEERRRAADILRDDLG